MAWLELVLATPHVFLPSARTRARLFHQLRLGEQSPVRTCHPGGKCLAPPFTRKVRFSTSSASGSHS